MTTKDEVREEEIKNEINKVSEIGLRSEFRAEIYSAISEMLDNPKDGIYPTSACFQRLEDYFISKFDSLLAKKREEAADKIKRKFNGYGGILGFTQQELLSILTN